MPLHLNVTFSDYHKSLTEPPSSRAVLRARGCRAGSKGLLLPIWDFQKTPGWLLMVPGRWPAWILIWSSRSCSKVHIQCIHCPSVQLILPLPAHLLNLKDDLSYDLFVDDFPEDGWATWALTISLTMSLLPHLAPAAFYSLLFTSPQIPTFLGKQVTHQLVECSSLASALLTLSPIHHSFPSFLPIFQTEQIKRSSHDHPGSAHCSIRNLGACCVRSSKEIKQTVNCYGALFVNT